MATYTITGRMSAKTVKKNFKESFGGTLRILKDGKPVDDSATMASLKADGCKGGELELKGNTKVAGMKKKVADLYGISVEVYDADDKNPLDDSLTLASIGASLPAAPAEKPMAKKENKEKLVKETKEKAAKEPKAALTPKADPAPKPEPAPAPAQPAAQGFTFDQLLDAALADGVVTDKERAILIKKATAQGYDPDEVEIMIDGKLAKMERKQELQAEAQPQPKPQPQPKQEPQTPPSVPETRESLMNKAKKLQEIGDTKEAIKIYKKIIMDYGERWIYYRKLWEIYEKEGDYKEALKFATRVADLNWENVGAWGSSLSNLIIKMFDEMLRANRKRDASRFLDSYGKYLDRNADYWEKFYREQYANSKLLYTLLSICKEKRTDYLREKIV